MLIRKFPNMGREEIRKMFKLADIRKTRVWQEALVEGEARGEAKGKAEGKAEGKTETRREIVARLLTKEMTHAQIADLVGITVQEVRRLAKAKPGSSEKA